ncbi:MAG: amino acid adenylation domain-containing protein, partial [Verrucomicrobiae bacterium]|nr:amino acid adenylation domain-containing protein [Verrucomicrobiae bacterium]
TFKQLLDQVRCSFREAREHQHVSLSVLAQRLAIERDSSRHPFYQTLFAMDKPREKPSLMWRPSRTDFHPGGSKLDLTLEMFECGESIQGQAEFDMELFKPETIDQLTNQYQSILEGILENPDAPVSTLNLLDTQEREKILYQFNNTEHPIDPCLRLHDGLTRFAEGTPQAVAVADPERTLTYAELERQSNSVAGYLQAHNIGPDDVVGVLAGRSVNLMVALFGVLKAGAGYLPVVPTLPRERIEYLLSDSDAKFVLTDDLNLVPPAYSGPAHTIADLIKSAESFKLEDRVEPHHLAYVIYTSGSTGKPKGTMIEHRSIVNRILWMADFYGFTSNDVMIQKTTISFDVSLHELFTWSFCGARLFLPPPETEKDPDVLLEVVKDQGITFMNFVPSMLNGFLNYLNGPDEIEALRSVRIVYCSGEALPPLTARKFQKLLGEPLGIELHNLYGPTEAAVEVTAFDCADLDSETEMPIGKPIWNTRLYILDENMRPLPIGVPGELYIGGVQVSRGYLNRPELNEKTFIPDPFSEDPEARLYRTGDQARWLPDGNVVYLGRRDFQIKIRGIRIEPGEIEAAILEHPRITGAAVTSFKNTNAETQIAAYFTHTGSPFEEADYQRLKEDLAEKLTEQMMPVFFQE